MLASRENVAFQAGDAQLGRPVEENATRKHRICVQRNAALARLALAVGNCHYLSNKSRSDQRRLRRSAARALVLAAIKAAAYTVVQFGLLRATAKSRFFSSSPIGKGRLRRQFCGGAEESLSILAPVAMELHRQFCQGL